LNFGKAAIEHFNENRDLFVRVLPGGAKTLIKWGGKINNHLLACCKYVCQKL